VVNRFIEYFTPENFKYEWDPVRLDCSLTLDSPIEITNVTLSNPIVITAVDHGLEDGDQIRIDNLAGTHQLNGQQFIVGIITNNSFALYEVP
jgi:hypothetical protein